jgi:hypothetical protein
MNSAKYGLWPNKCYNIQPKKSLVKNYISKISSPILLPSYEAVIFMVMDTCFNISF